MWMTMVWAGVVTNGSIERMTTVLIISGWLFALFVVRCLPVTTLWSDFILASFWGCMFAVASSYLPANHVFGMQQLGMYTIWVWLGGVHSSFVMYFTMLACASIYMSSSSDMLTKHATMSFGCMSLFLATWLEWQSVSHFHRLMKLVKVGADGLFTLNKATGNIVSASKEASELIGESLAGSPMHRVTHDNDRARVGQWLKQSAGDPSEAFLATLCFTHTLQSMPTSEFEARIIPYDVSGSNLHVCFQLVGEVRRTYGPMPRDAPSQSSLSAERTLQSLEQPLEDDRPSLTPQSRVDDACAARDPRAVDDLGVTPRTESDVFTLSADSPSEAKSAAGPQQPAPARQQASPSAGPPRAAGEAAGVDEVRKRAWGARPIQVAGAAEAGALLAPARGERDEEDPGEASAFQPISRTQRRRMYTEEGQDRAQRFLARPAPAGRSGEQH
ncbi:unnamed protein product [Prorocentrum cordatum]|uniref:PAS domain-containing protein n=1 Tax=Prorocentrum cordatum TaxID=2364126 RepID=A0ABN9YBC9_9DINO|nr:unnamed protein product [Polarella glacialis]